MADCEFNLNHSEEVRSQANDGMMEDLFPDGAE